MLAIALQVISAFLLHLQFISPFTLLSFILPHYRFLHLLLRYLIFLIELKFRGDSYLDYFTFSRIRQTQSILHF